MMEQFFKKVLSSVKQKVREIGNHVWGKDLSEEKNEFVSIASHQLRTPISALLGYLSLLRDGNYGKLTSEQLDVINKSFKITVGMENMVDNFLSVAHAEKGTL